MVVNREIIQSIRVRRAVRQLEELLAQGAELSETLLRQSGLLEKGLDPRQLNLSPEQMEIFLRAAEQAEAEVLADDVGRRPGEGRTRV